MELLSRLQSQQGRINPSAWMVGAAFAAGAHADTNVSRGGANSQQLSSMNVDAAAQALLTSLPQSEQDHIIATLEQSLAAGQIQNVSAWVAKACLKSKAVASGAGKAGKMGGYSSFRA